MSTRHRLLLSRREKQMPFVPAWNQIDSGVQLLPVGNCVYVLEESPNRVGSSLEATGAVSSQEWGGNKIRIERHFEKSGVCESESV